MNKKKLLALLMALVMTFSLVPVTAFAEGEPEASFNPTGTDDGWIDGSFANALDYKYNFENLGEHKAISIQLYSDITLSENMSFPYNPDGEVIYSVSSGVTQEDGDGYLIDAPVTIDPGSHTITIPVGVTVWLEDVNHIKGEDHNIELFSAPVGYKVRKATLSECYSLEPANAATPAWTHIWDENQAEATKELLNAKPYQITAHLWLDGVEDDSFFPQTSTLDPDETIGDSLDALWAALYYFFGAPSELANNDITVQVTDVVNYVAKIGETKYTTLQAAIDAAQDGDTISLLGDASGAGIFIGPNKFTESGLAINFGGYTYTVTSPVGSTGTVNQMLHFEQGNKITLTNGTINITDDSTERDAFEMIMQNYCALTIDGMTIDGSDIAVAKYSDPKYEAYPGWYNTDKPQFNYNTAGNSVIRNSTITVEGDLGIDDSANVTFGGDAVIYANKIATHGTDTRYTSTTSVTTVENGAKFSCDPTAVLANDQKAVLTDGLYEVTAKDYVAQIDETGVKYETLADAVSNATAGQTITLLSNIDLTATVNITKNLTIDLAGNDITAADARALHVQSGEVTITGEGTITSTKSANSSFSSGSSVIRVGNSGSEKAKLTIDSDVIVDAPYTYGVTVFGTNAGGIELEVNGTVRSSGSEAAISGNGNTGNKGAVTINAGATVTAVNAEAIYHPQGDSLTINGGTITGKTGIYQKSGTLTVKGGTITGNGDKVVYNPTGDDCVPTGDAIVIDNCGYPGGAPTVSITGGIFASENADAVGSYYGGTATAAVTGFITGGTFDGEPDTEYIANGHEAVNGEQAGWYQVVAADSAVAKIGDVKYATLQGAFNVGGDVTLLRNVVLSEPAVVTENVNLDMAGHTINNVNDIWAGSDWSLISVHAGGDLTVTGNGTVSAKKNDCYAFDVRDGGKLTIENGTFVGNISAVYVTNEDDIGVSELTVNGGTFSILQLSNYNDYRYTLNCFDKSYTSDTAKITVKGGTFEGFDPSNCLAEGVNTNFVAEGYEAVENNGTWTVQAKAVAKIGTTEYTTLQAAFNNVQDGETITLLDNLTQDDGVLFDHEGVSAKLNLNGKTFTVNKGSNVNSRAIKILNGTLEVYDGSIVAFGSGTTSSNGTGCYGAFRVEADGVLNAHNLTLTNARPWGLNVKVCGGKATLTDVTINSSYGGGIEVTEVTLGGQSQKGEATLTDCTFTQTGYFDHCSTCLSVSGGSELVINSGSYSGDNHVLYVFSSGGVIKVNGGTFTDTGTDDKAAIVAAIDTNTYPQYTGGLAISGGNINGTYAITSPAYMTITGGVFDHDPSTYVADGYEAVANQPTSGKWQVGKVQSTAIAKTTDGNSDTEATYTASRRVVDENEETIAGSDQTTVTVNLSASAGTVATNNELPRYDQEKIVAKALEVSNAANMNVSIDVESNSLTEVVNKKITYEVHPVATVTATGSSTPAGTFIVTNDMLSGQTFTIKLPVPLALQTEGWVKVTHKLNNGGTVEYAKLKVDNGYVTIADVTEFSEFELEMIVVDSNPSANCGFTLALKNKIEIPFYIYNLTGDPSEYTVEYSYTDANNQQISDSVNLDEIDSVGNGWYRVVVASFSARQIRDTVHVVLKANDTEIYTVDYSVSKYCTDMINGGTNTASLITLCKAMMDYGTAAQWNFGYNTAQASNYTYYFLNSTQAMGDEYSNSFNTEESNVFSYIGATLSLRSQTELNFYFTLTNVNIEDYTFKVNGVVVTPTPVSSSSYYRVTASEITAKNLDKQVTVTVTNNTDTSKVERYSYSPLNYAYYIQENSPTDKLKTVCSGLYLYWQAANDYLK